MAGGTLSNPSDSAAQRLRDLPPAARVYVAAVLAAGVATVVVFAPRSADNPALFLILLVCCSVASALNVRVPLAGSHSSISVPYAVHFASIVLAGANPAMIVAGAGALSEGTFTAPSRSTHRVLFSIASQAITVKAAGAVYAWLGGLPPSMPLSLVDLPGPLLGAAVAHFICGTGLMAIGIGASTRQSIVKVWRENFLGSAPGALVGAAAGAVAAIIVYSGSYWMALLAAAPPYFIYRTYTVYVGRIHDQQQHVQQVSDLHLATIEALALAIDAKDQTAQSHVRRVQVYAAGLAGALGMSDNEIQGVKTASLLHDIGKLAVPEHILSKPGPLTHEEFQKIRIHPQVGAEIITGVPFPYPVPPLILSHHGRYDGKGYPSGRKSD